MRRFGFLLFVLVGSFAAASASARPHALVPLKLVGSYETFLPAGPGTEKGRYAIAIGRHGAFVVTTPRLNALALGPASVNGNTLTLPPDRARDGACAGPGIYTWHRNGRRLTFVRVDDACRARIFRLTERPWRRFTDYSPVIIIRR